MRSIMGRLMQGLRPCSNAFCLEAHCWRRRLWPRTGSRRRRRRRVWRSSTELERLDRYRFRQLRPWLSLRAAHRQRQDLLRQSEFQHKRSGQCPRPGQRHGQCRRAKRVGHRPAVARLRRRHLDRPLGERSVLRPLGSRAPRGRRLLADHRCGYLAHRARGVAAQHLSRQRPGMGRVLDHERAVDDDGGARA